MSTIWIPPQRVDPPAVEETHTARPTAGNTAGGLVESATHLAGLRFLRCSGRIVEYVPGGDPDAPDMEVRARWTTSPLARFVWVGVEYFAAKITGYTPKIDISLVSPDEITTYDAGVRLTSAANTLRLIAGGGDDLSALGNTPREYAHTGFRQRPGDTGQTTARRLLNINTAGGANTDVVCKLSTVRCRVLAVTVWECYQESIEQ